MLVDAASVSRVWAVVSVKPRMEGTAEDLLRREGLSPYCPRFKARQSDANVRPLFPGYLFIRLSPALDLSKIRSLPGIRKPLMFQRQVACVEDELIGHWQSREGGRGYSVPEPPVPFHPGERVRLVQGPFSGLEAIVLEALPARQRVRLLIEYLGGTLHLEVDGDVLR